MPEEQLRHFISQNFHHTKLEQPALGDLIDVFEDRMRNWLLLPAKHLIDTPNGLVAATALLSGYFEGIEIYLSGKDSKNRSSEFLDTPKHPPLQGSEHPTTRRQTVGAIKPRRRCASITFGE
jgi:hypothetical protein